MTKINGKFECSFCEATVRHIGEKEVEAGWGRAKGRMNGLLVDVIHCPRHENQLIPTLLDCGELAAKKKIK